MEETLIRVGVFDGSGRILGKAKRSTKLERGGSVVLRRVVRCIQDAVDECDLDMNAVAAAGVALGAAAEAWGPLPFTPAIRGQIQGTLTAGLGLPVFVESDHQLATLGVYEAELDRPVARFAALFCGLELQGGLLVKGEFAAPELAGWLDQALRAARRRVRERLPAPMPNWSKAEFRKAARRRDRQACAVAGVLAAELGVVAGELIETQGPEVIFLGGGAMDELKGDLLPIVMESARGHVKHPDVVSGARLCVSELADNATLVGSAFYARRRLGSEAASAAF